MTRSADQAEGRGSPLTHSKNVVPSGTFLFHLFIRRSFLARLLASVHSGSSTGQLTCPIYYDRNHVGVGARAGPTRKKAAPNHARARTRMAAKGRRGWRCKKPLPFRKLRTTDYDYAVAAMAVAPAAAVVRLCNITFPYRQIIPRGASYRSGHPVG